MRMQHFGLALAAAMGLFLATNIRAAESTLVEQLSQSSADYQAQLDATYAAARKSDRPADWDAFAAKFPLIHTRHGRNPHADEALQKRTGQWTTASQAPAWVQSWHSYRQAVSGEGSGIGIVERIGDKELEELTDPWLVAYFRALLQLALVEGQAQQKTGTVTVQLTPQVECAALDKFNKQPSPAVIYQAPTMREQLAGFTLDGSNVLFKSYQSETGRMQEGNVNYDYERVLTGRCSIQGTDLRSVLDALPPAATYQNLDRGKVAVRVTRKR